MNPVYEKLVNCYNSVREKIDFVPDVALVLGSGLGDYGKEIEVVAELSYRDILHSNALFPAYKLLLYLLHNRK